MIPFFSFESRNLDIRSELLKTFEAFFDASWYVLGKFTSQFESDYAAFSGTKYCVGVSNGLDALHLSLRALGIGPGDEVIVPSNTYIATVLAVTYTGATPVFVEPRWETANLNPELVEKAINKKTKCIIPVHLYGQACEMDAIMAIAEEYGIYVVEDNAQAQGATFNGKKTGSFGHINATSFYPTKNLGALGEAGAITTDNESLAEKIRILRNYGSSQRYFNEVIGYNNRIDEFECAYLSLALKHLEGWNAERNSIAEKYRDLLGSLDGISLITVYPLANTVNHLFVIKCQQRDKLKKYLESNGIGTQIHYPVPPHLQKAYAHLGFKKGDFPIAEKLADTCLSLPIYPGLELKHVQHICEVIAQF